jgi:hypothetical protein
MTTQSDLLVAKVDVVLVEPWDVVTVNGSGTFVADVVQIGQVKSTGTESLLIELHAALKHDRQEYKYLVATPRHVGTTFERLLSGEQVGVNLTGIPGERAKSADPFDLSWWRGGAAAIADLRLHT